MAAGFLGMGLSQNLWQLSLSYGVMVGMAMGACGLAIMSLLISKHFDARSRGLAVSVIQTAPPLSPLIFAPLLFFLMVTFDWRVAAMATSALLVGVALPLAWIGARDPESARISRRERAGWGACLPYLRNRSMLLLFAARFSCGVAFFQIAHLVALTGRGECAEADRRVNSQGQRSQTRGIYRCQFHGGTRKNGLHKINLELG